MKRTCIPIILLLLGLTLYGQNETRRIGGFEIGFGVNALGPNAHMAGLMEEYNFNAGVANWVYLSDKEYPFYFPLGITVELAYFRILKERHSAGLMLDYSRFSKVHGYSDRSKELDLVFSSQSMLPFYRYRLSDYLQVQAGIPLMLNRGRKTSIYDENVEETRDHYLRFSTGVMAGLNLDLWDGTDTYGKLSLNYTLCLNNTMGPFSAVYGFGDLDTIPEDNFNFSHLSLVFTLGFHHWYFKSL